MTALSSPPTPSATGTATGRRRVSPRTRALLMAAVAVAVLVLLVLRFGASTFLDGVRMVDATTIAVAAVVGLVTTVACSLRWRLVSSSLGSELPVREAIPAYYRSQFLNSVLPLAVVGDVHRGVARGRVDGGTALGLRAVAWERVIGQVVQLAIVAVVLVLLPSPVRSTSAYLWVALLAIGAVAWAVHASDRAATAREVPGEVRVPRGRIARVVRRAVSDVRLLGGRTALGVVLLSAVVVAGHCLTFVVASRTAGAVAPLTVLVPIALLVLVATSVPTHLAGWGLREGAAAWAFTAAGLGGATGVQAGVIFGVVTTIATLPGALVLLFPSLAGRRTDAAATIDLTDDVAPAVAGVRLARPYTILSCAVSLDGYLDDGSDERLVLSSQADLDRVDAVRAECDAILVGATTLRRDNPRLRVRSPRRRAQRVAAGRSATPAKVTLTQQGAIDPGAEFFADDGAAKLVYCSGPARATLPPRLEGRAVVVDAGDDVDLEWLVRDLAARGVGRLLVEGGASVLTQFLAAGLADELHLVVAPFFVGDPGGTRFVRPAAFPWTPGRPARLADVRSIDDVVLLRYLLTSESDGGSR